MLWNAYFSNLILNNITATQSLISMLSVSTEFYIPRQYTHTDLHMLHLFSHSLLRMSSVCHLVQLCKYSYKNTGKNPWCSHKPVHSHDHWWYTHQCPHSQPDWLLCTLVYTSIGKIRQYLYILDHRHHSHLCIHQCSYSCDCLHLSVGNPQDNHIGNCYQTVLHRCENMGRWDRDPHLKHNMSHHG